MLLPRINAVTTQQRSGSGIRWPSKGTLTRSSTSASCTRAARVCCETTPRRSSGIAKPQSRTTPSRSLILASCTPRARACRQNHAEAALWYRLAADHGLAGAQFNLGMMYVEGQGVSQDYVQAHMWLNLAASQLPALGKDQRNTTVDARDRVASKMTPPQIVEAQELAFEWTAEHRHVGRLRALLEACTLGKETPERLAVVPDQVQAQSGDLQGSPVFSSVGLHGLILEDRSSKPTRRALMNLRPSGRR